METCNIVSTFESVNEIVWRDHSNETSLAVLSLATICFSISSKMKSGICLDFGLWTLLGVQGLKNPT